MPQIEPDAAKEAAGLVRDKVMGSLFQEDGQYLSIGDLDEIDRMYLIERHLISRELVNGECERGVAFGESEITAVMINEEDHVRLQVIFSGMELDRAWGEAQRVDGILEKQSALSSALDKGMEGFTER